MAAPGTTFSSQIDKSQIFELIKACIEPTKGFYVDHNGKKLLIKPKESAECDIPQNVKAALYPSSSPKSYEGLGIYYAWYENGVFMCHKGRISSSSEVDDSNIFTIDGPHLSEATGSPVFTYDKVNRTLHLLGMIDAAQRVVQINLFQAQEAQDDLGPERGGGKVQVESGNYKGIESGKGRGHRSIIINGPGIPQGGRNYKITWQLDGKPHNVHESSAYKKPKSVYQAALDAFVGRPNADQIPPDFEFQIGNEDFKATT